MPSLYTLLTRAAAGLVSLPFRQPYPKEGSGFAVVPASGAAAAADAAHVRQMAEVHMASFGQERANTFFWSKRADGEVDAERMLGWLVEYTGDAMRNPDYRHFQVATTEEEAQGGDGDVIAWAKWGVPRGYEKQFGAWKGDDNRKPAEGAKKTPCPPGTPLKLCEEYFGKLYDNWKRITDGKMLYLDTINTDPRYGGGKAKAASHLIRPMLELADEHRLDTYLEATDAGRPVYEHYGFREVDTVRWPVAKLVGLPSWRDVPDLKMTLMIRKHQPR